MSHFLRQFHIMSSLKSSSDKELYPFYKTIAPILTLYPAVRKLHTKNVGRNLHLKTHDQESSGNKKKQKPLAVIVAWMLAKDSHIDKYRNLYLTRGFDVLTVDLSPKELLFPASGSQVVASSLLNYLVSNDHYHKIVIHAFSVGGYLLGELFQKMRQNTTVCKSVVDRMCGVVMDSAVDFEGIPTGFPRAVSKNPLTIKVLEWYISSHLALMYNVATKHYLTSSKNFHNTPLRCPALFFVSDADKVGTPSSNQLVADNWIARGCDVKMKCWQDSKHVSHLHKHEQEYISELDQFLSKINLSSVN